LERIVKTVEKTFQHLKGEIQMSKKEYYEGFSEEKQKEYELYVRQRWGDDTYEVSAKKWKAMSVEEKNAYKIHGEELIRAVAACVDKGYQHPAAQTLIGQYRDHLSLFYDITLDIYEGLGHVYNQHPDFVAFYDSFAPGLATFMEQAVVFYCQQHRT
jgi:hypothetical protein